MTKWIKEKPLKVFTCRECLGDTVCTTEPAGWKEIWSRADWDEGIKSRPTGEWLCPYCRIQHKEEYESKYGEPYGYGHVEY